MKKTLKKQVMAALAATAVLGAVGGVPSYAVDKSVILTPQGTLKDVIHDRVTDGEKTTGNYFYGIVGGDVHTDSLLGRLGNKLLFEPEDRLGPVTESPEAISGENAGLKLTGATIGEAWNARYYGAIGGRLLVNSNVNINLPIEDDGKPIPNGVTEKLSADIDGDVNNTITGGNVIGGVGGSAAVGIGNVSANALGNRITVTTGGSASTTIHGSVTTTAGVDTKNNKYSNLVGFMNGGLAAGIGGDASSEVTGDTVLNIIGTGRAANTNKEDPNLDTIHQLTTGLNVMHQSNISAIGVTGGGAAVSTLGSHASSTVGGTTTININGATVIGAIGGGAAASIDATDVGDVLADKLAPNPDSGTHPPVGDPSGESGFGIDFSDDGLQIVTGEGEERAPAHVTISNVYNGGVAESITGNTNISIVGNEKIGNSTVIGVLGGGVAAATQTYYDHAKPEIAATADADAKYTIYGKSKASATTGKATIDINLENKLTDAEKSAFMGALGAFKKGLAPNEDGKPETIMKGDVLAPIANKGAVGAVFGGGASLAFGSIETAYDPDSRDEKGAYAKAETAGADINLANGYAAGIMGGGIAGVRGNAYAESIMSDTVNINIGGFTNTLSDESAEAVGVFGNGLAYYTGDANFGKKNLNGQAVVTAANTNINVAGKADGLIGGGMAIDDSQSDTVNATVQTNGTATINVYEGARIDKVGFEALDGLVGTVPTNGIDMGSYVDGVKAAAGNAAIAAGGIALGGGANAEVANAEVNIIGGTVTGDVYGGGIAAYGYGENNGGSTVETSTINLIGGKVDGNVYAGGAVATKTSTGVDVYSSYNKATATVGKAVTNLAGAEVTGILYGTGTVNQKVLEETDAAAAQAAVDDSTLNLLGENTLSTVKDETERTESSKIQAYNHVTATSGSRTTLTGISAGNTVAIIDGGEGKVESGAYADVNAFKGNGTYHVGDNMTGSLWQDDALIYDRMNGRYAEINTGDGTDYDIVFKDIETEEDAKKAADSMSDALDAGSASNLIQQGMRDGWHNISGGADEYFDDWQNHKDSNAAFRRGMMIGEDAAVTGNTVSIARDMADNVMQRLSFTDDYVQDKGWVNNDGGIWAKYIHRKYETDSMGSSMGGIHSSTDYDGAIVGVDFAKHGNFQSGVAFHYGSGDGNGLISRNDYDAWGFTLYGSLKDEEAGTNLMADIGYVTSDNDIDGTVAGKSLSADRDVDAWTIGLRGEKEYTFGQNQLVPYVGLRYMSVNPARYTAYYNGKAAFDYDADNQNLWLLPIGVSFRNETVTDGGWRITPKLDLSYIWAFGDTDTDMTVNAGTYSTALYYDVMDDNSWLASLGVEATKDVWSFGVGYGYQKGDDTKNKTWFVNASYAF